MKKKNKTLRSMTDEELKQSKKDLQAEVIKLKVRIETKKNKIARIEGELLMRSL